MANAGEVLLLPLYGEPGFPQYFHAVADVYNPSLDLAWSTTNGSGSLHTLVASGKYTVVVHADDYAHVGNYGLSVAFLSGRCGSAPSAFGPLTGEIATPAQVYSYAFRANAGDVVRFSIYGEPGFPQYFNAVASIFNALGELIASSTNGPTGLLNLTNSGVYTVAVHADNFANTGSYGLSVVPLSVASAPVGQSVSQTNHAPDLTLWGQLGNTTTVQYATNLLQTNTWLTLTNLTFSWSPLHFVDWSATNVQQRFYRQVQLQ